MSTGSGGGHGEAAGDIEMEEDLEPPPLFDWQEHTCLPPVEVVGVEERHPWIETCPPPELGEA